VTQDDVTQVVTAAGRAGQVVLRLVTPVALVAVGLVPVVVRVSLVVMVRVVDVLVAGVRGLGSPGLSRARVGSVATRQGCVVPGHASLPYRKANRVRRTSPLR
jgi:hypothetical protein